MGEAKRRGPPEIRIQEGILKWEQREQERLTAHLKRESILTDEQKSRRLELMALLGLSMSHFGIS